MRPFRVGVNGDMRFTDDRYDCHSDWGKLVVSQLFKVKPATADSGLEQVFKPTSVIEEFSVLDR